MEVYRHRLKEEEIKYYYVCDECGGAFKEYWVIQPSTPGDECIWLCNDCIKLLREKIDRLRLLVI